MRKNGKRGTRMVKVDNALLVVQTRGGEILYCIIVTDKSRRPLSHHAAALICSVHRARKNMPAPIER